MAKWVSANMAGFLPAGTTDILEEIQGLVSIVKTPLDVVSSALQVSKSFLTSNVPYDFMSELRKSIVTFKEATIFGGIYACQMWDYPVKQVMGEVGRTYHGPDAGLDTLNFLGNKFESSFMRDLTDSFYDYQDPNRPQFSGDVSMLLLINAAPSINSIGLNSSEANIGDSLYGMKNSIAAATKTIRRIRSAAMLTKLKKHAQAQPADKVAIRVSRIEQALHYLGQLTNTQLDCIEFPESEESSYFEDQDFDEIDWQTEVLPFLQSIERQFVPSVYPDWNKISISDANPGFAAYVNSVLDPVLDLLAQGSSINNSIVTLITAIDNKLKSLDNIISRIDSINEEFDRMLSVLGLHAIYISSSSGISDIATQLQNATNLPFSGNNFYAGVALVAGPGSKEAFDLMFSPIGS